VEAGGATDPLTKSNPGGWSQQRFQQRAENTWAENADDVAEELTKLVDRVEAGLVVAAGDVRALQLLREALPDRVGELLHVVEGGRGADGSKEEIAAEAAEQVQAAANDATEALLEKLREEAGQQDKAAEGVAATAQALSMGQVEVLLLHDEPEEDRSAWFGPDPIPVAAAPEALESLGVESAQEGRLADVLIRAALATGAGIRIIPPVGGPADGVGALLRWST
jgi:peptide subunit release factor 1 (eRF1)